MGQLAKCRVVCPAGNAEAEAHLDGTELLIRGPFRWRVRFAELGSVEVREGKLMLSGDAGETALDLGDATAEKWADKIRNPPSLMKKLGVKAGVRYSIAGEDEGTFFQELEAAGAVESQHNPEMLFVFAQSEMDLAKVWDGAATIWIIYPKGRKDFTEAQVRNHGRAMGMMDTKVASFSTTLTALRFSRTVRAT